MSKCLCASMRGLSLNTRNEFFGNAVSFHDAAPRKMSSSMTIEAAHKKGAGSTKNGRDSISKRRGVKVFGMQKVKAGGIIMRQLGTKVSDVVSSSFGCVRLVSSWRERWIGTRLYHLCEARRDCFL